MPNDSKHSGISVQDIQPSICKKKINIRSQTLKHKSTTRSDVLNPNLIRNPHMLGPDIDAFGNTVQT